MTDYKNIPGVNWSTLKHMRRSPRHYLHALEHGTPDSPARLLGRVTHCAVYEPDKLQERYVFMPNFHGGMNDETAHDKGYAGGKQAKAAWLSVFGSGKWEIVERDLYERALAMATAVRADPIAGPLLRGTYVEQTITWTDPLTGLPCKGILDQINGRLGDLKSTEQFLPRQFASSVERLGHLGQLAFYSDGLQANGIVVDDLPVFITVESKPPYDVVVYEVSENDLDAGRALYQKLLQQLAECQRTGHFPGIAGGEMLKLHRPAWAVVDDDEPVLTMGGEPLSI